MFLLRDGHVKILDFGLAAVGRAPAETPLNRLCGPDRCRHGARHGRLHGARTGARRRRGPRTDLFAFGAVLYELLRPASLPARYRGRDDDSDSPQGSAGLRRRPRALPGARSYRPPRDRERADDRFHPRAISPSPWRRSATRAGPAPAPPPHAPPSRRASARANASRGLPRPSSPSRPRSDALTDTTFFESCATPDPGASIRPQHHSSDSHEDPECSCPHNLPFANSAAGSRTYCLRRLPPGQTP